MQYRFVDYITVNENSFGNIGGGGGTGVGVGVGVGDGVIVSGLLPNPRFPRKVHPPSAKVALPARSKSFSFWAFIPTSLHLILPDYTKPWQKCGSN